jgi:hypothetical protein
MCNPQDIKHSFPLLSVINHCSELISALQNNNMLSTKMAVSSQCLLNGNQDFGKFEETFQLRSQDLNNINVALDNYIWNIWKDNNVIQQHIRHDMTSCYNKKCFGKSESLFYGIPDA